MKTLFLRRCAQLLFGLCLSLPLQARDNHPKPSDEQMSAVFLYNFALFVSWPEAAFTTAQSPLRYCVIDEQSLFDTLTLTLRGEVIQGRSLVASFYNSGDLQNKDKADLLSQCQVVYVGQKAMHSWSVVKSICAGKPILSVSDQLDFVAKQGGMISLLKEKKRIRPAINTANVDYSALKVSAKLLRISQRMGGN